MISTSYNLMQQLSDNAGTINSQLSVAEAQASTGLVSQTYSGLGSNVRTALDLQPTITHLSVWQSNIDSATTRLNVTQTALSTISQIATNFYAQVNNINNIGVSDVSNIAIQAKSALQQVAQALNTKSGDVYVFAGQDTSNPPIPDTSTATLTTALLASPTTTAPFSSSIGSAVPQVDVGDGQKVQIGLLANANTLAVSSAPTSGSYMRDIMTSLATLANLTAGPSAETTAQTVRSQLSSAITAIGTETGALGDIQSSLTQRQTTLSATSTALSAQLSSATEVDMAATMTKVSTLQSQLQASYHLMANLEGMGLASYLK